MSCTKRFRVWILLAVVLLLAAGFLLFRAQGGIGPGASSLEKDARSSQKIDPQWLCAQETGDEMAVLLFYPQDRQDHTFSVYWKRPGLSLGYTFRGGGSLSLIDEGILCFSIENCPQKAYLSLNRPGIREVQVDDGNTPYTIALDPETPFVLVLDQNCGTVTFLDQEGQTVEPQFQNL